MKRLCFWETLHAFWKWLPELQDKRTACFLPDSAFAARILCHQVPLSALSQAQCIDRCEAEVDFLSCCYLHPGRTYISRAEFLLK